MYAFLKKFTTECSHWYVNVSYLACYRIKDVWLCMNSTQIHFSMVWLVLCCTEMHKLTNQITRTARLSLLYTTGSPHIQGNLITVNFDHDAFEFAVSSTLSVFLHIEKNEPFAYCIAHADQFTVPLLYVTKYIKYVLDVVISNAACTITYSSE